MSSVTAFFSCTLAYGMKLQGSQQNELSTPYFEVENCERVLLRPRYVYDINEDFRVSSAHRGSQILAIQNDSLTVFYVNRQDLTDLAPGLVRRLGRERIARDGRHYGIGEIGIIIEDMQMMLSLIFNCYELEMKNKVLDNNLFQMLYLARRFRIVNLAEECRQHVLNADYTKLSYKTVKSWTDAFRKNEKFVSDEKIVPMLNEKLMDIFLRDSKECLNRMKFGIPRSFKCTDINCPMRPYQHSNEKQEQRWQKIF